jgi:hypothetical protein
MGDRPKPPANRSSLKDTAPLSRSPAPPTDGFRLRRLDYYDGKVDGVFGAKTRAAIERFQTSEGITVSGAPNEDTLLRLLFKTVSDNVDDN